MASVKQAAVQAATAAPENPFGEEAGHVMLTAPHHAPGLLAELSAAMPQVATALRAPADSDKPVSAANPAWLAYTGTGGSESTVRRVVAAHDPTSSSDAPRNIGGSGVAQGLRDLREKLSAGEVLDAIEVSNAIALLLGIYPPGASTAAQG